MTFFIHAVSRRAGIALAVLSLLVATPVLAEDWIVAPAPTEDEPFDTAQTRSEGGDSLIVWSRPSAAGLQVFAELHPAEGVAFAGTMPVYRVDEDEPVDTDLIRFKGEENNALWGMAREHVAFWLLWESSEAIVLPGDPLHRWIQGRELEVSITLADGSTRVMRFSLAGSGAAIQQATGVALK